MIKIRVLVIVTVIFFVTFLYYAVNCQKSTKQAPKNEINLRNIRNKKNNGNGNGGNNSGNNNNNKRNGKNNNRGKNRRNKRIKGKGKNNNNNGGNNNNNNGNSYNDNGFLSIQKGNMVYKKKKVFISGVNIQYISFGKDFGNGGYASVKAQYESWLKQISGAGGNALRILLHTNGTFTPKLDSQGYATGEDTASLIQDLGQFLDTAANYNVFVFITLWNGAMNMTADKVDIYKSDVKLDRYIEKVLKPMVSGLKTKKALGAWEVITTPQGTVRSNIVDSNPCFDTQYLFHQIATFTTNNSTMKDMQKFINKQLDAIKIADPKALRSVISKEEEASEYCDWCYNYWSDKCLTAAGGKPNGVLDYYGLDAVPFSGTDYYWSPLRKMASDYKLNKPILIAMTSGTCSDSKSIVTNYNHAINSGYTGAFGWRYNPGLKNNCNDSPAQCDAGMSAVKNNDMTKINMN